MNSVWDWMLALAVMVVMEPVTYLAHRYVMHGVGMGWHRSHHRRRRSGFEKNDLYPVVFASATIALMAFGAVFGPPVLFPIGVGISLYGLAYLFAHELYIHRRWTRFTARLPWFEHLAEAHALHHRFGGEPYGFLFPVVPASLRRRAAEAEASRPMDRAYVLSGAAEGD